MSARELKDSRRLTGPNVLWERPGAILDIALEPTEIEPAIEAWRDSASELLEAVGWADQELMARRYPGGVSLALSAPIDALYAATEVNEAAWGEAEGHLADDEKKSGHNADLIAGLRDAIAAESNPPLIDLQRSAAKHGVAFLSDDDHCSVGLGTGARTWAVDEIPAPVDIPWGEIHDIPVAMVTGTNGKTTTVRLLAAMVSAGSRVPGVSSTDWLKVGDELVDSGDWSGPGGARAILRNNRVEMAILETARGGMLRRGLGVTAADVAAVLNVAEDHLGEWGVEDLAALVEAKFVVARAARHLVLNADDAEVVARARTVTLPITWFGLDIDAELRVSSLRDGGTVLTVDQGRVLIERRAATRTLCRVSDIPIALNGAARHNLSNALAATAVALRLGLDEAAIVAGLGAFHSDPLENPGRLNRFRLGEADVLVDFAHNPHGLEALLDMAAALPAKRRLVLIGQAGDRTDTSIRDLARIVWRARPERIIIKEMLKYLRGREAGEVPRLIAKELVAVGAPDEVIGHADSEMEAVRQSLEWARPGDLLLILTHESRNEVLELCSELQQRDWQPGQPLPPAG